MKGVARDGVDRQARRALPAGPVGFTDLRALFINCTLKRSPELSHTQGLADISIAIMARQGVFVEAVRAIDSDIATGVWPDMTEHGWPRRLATDSRARDGVGHLGGVLADLARREVLGVHTSDRAALRQLTPTQRRGPVRVLRTVGGCLVTGNEDGVKHCAMNILYSLQHLGYVIPPQADAGWIGEAGPGPSYLDPGSGGPENDFTNRNTTFMTWNLLHLARIIKDAGGIPRTATSGPTGTPAVASTSRTPITVDKENKMAFVHSSRCVPRTSTRS